MDKFFLFYFLDKLFMYALPTQLPYWSHPTEREQYVVNIVEELGTYDTNYYIPVVELCSSYNQCYKNQSNTGYLENQKLRETYRFGLLGYFVLQISRELISKSTNFTWC